MSSTNPAPRARPTTSAPPKSPRTEENPGYRRGRAIRSCLECRRRKMRCNRSRPCQNCNRFCRDCVYLAFPEWPSGASNNAGREVGSQPPEQSRDRAFPPSDSSQQNAVVQLAPFAHHDRGYDSNILVKHESYDADTDLQPSDVGLQIGKLSISEKTNGSFKPHLASQIATLLSQTDHGVPLHGPQNAYGVPTTQRPPSPATSSTFGILKRSLPLEPSPGLLVSHSLLHLAGLELPGYQELQLLYHQYWSAVDPLAHVIHKPSFELEIRNYLPHGQVIDEAPASFKALLLAMCLAAAVSLPLMQAEEALGVPQDALIEKLKAATEKALTNARFMSPSKIQTLQAFTVYVIPQCHAEISKSHTEFVRELIRLAKGAGLDRDASGPEMDPVDCQVRRLLWHQVCFLDLITTEVQGLQPTIHDSEFNTCLPLNIKDDALDQSSNQSISPSGWTEATFSIIRYECGMVHRFIIAQNLAIDHGETDLKTVQHLVNVQRMRIERQYLQYLDDNIPIQRCAKFILQLLTARFDAILLQRNSRFDVKMESQTDIRETLVPSCLTVCKSAMALETDPELAPWAWYAKTHHQYETSIPLLMVIHRNPYDTSAECINHVLDHVFGVAPKSTSRERSRNILQLLLEKLNKMNQPREIKTSQRAVSDNGSSSPNDYSSMTRTPEDGQSWNHWQPDMMYRNGYTHSLPPLSPDMWWPIPIQHGMACGSPVPQHQVYTGPQPEYYGYGPGAGSI